MARFLREAQAAARIQSEHVGKVFDWGTLNSGVPYMVMEHLSGHDLRQELTERGRLPIPEAIDVLLQAIDGIAEAQLRETRAASSSACAARNPPKKIGRGFGYRTGETQTLPMQLAPDGHDESTSHVSSRRLKLSQSRTP
jgi:hypothetical protein